LGESLADDDSFQIEDEEPHPLLQRAMDLLVRFDSLFPDQDAGFAPSLARGSLFPLRSTLSAEQFDELFRTLQQMETDMVSELGKLRSEFQEDDR
jgi:hypothetical protein